MNWKKVLPVFLFSTGLFLISFVFGYQIMRKQIKGDELARLNQDMIGIGREKDLEILSDKNIITPNTIIEERINYSVCNHVVTEERQIDKAFVNMSRDDLIDYLEDMEPEKKLLSFSSNKVRIGLTKNHLCRNHYIIGEVDGYLAIFNIDQEGEPILRTKFEENPISLLMEVDQERIKKGILVDSEEELMEILENFIT